MGSVIEMNDTLELTREQGFPSELTWEEHQRRPLTAKDFKGQMFKFKNKPGHRVFQHPPVRNFLAENRDGKWLYWGLVHVWNTVHDPLANTSSGRFTIIYLYTPEEMKKIHALIDRNPKTDYFGSL